MRLLAISYWALLFSVAGCDGDEPVTITFETNFADQTFRCGERVEGVGISSSDFTATDFRFYLHELRLISDSGAEVEIELVDDGIWQNGEVALLDYEDCTNGTSEMRAEVFGHIPDGNYKGLKFKLGVPFDLNHANVATAQSPLNLSSMFWSWQGGYKFLRLDATVGDKDFFFHLGSVGCQGTIGAIHSCTSPNRPEFLLSDFMLGDSVVIDLNVLLSNMDFAVEDDSIACMGDPGSRYCDPIFDVLGLNEGHKGADGLFYVK